MTERLFTEQEVSKLMEGHRKGLQATIAEQIVTIAEQAKTIESLSRQVVELKATVDRKPVSWYTRLVGGDA